jgi:hypothetical protein
VLEVGTQGLGFFLSPENPAQHAIQFEVVAGGQRVGDDQVWNEIGQSFDFFATVFIDVDQYMRRLQHAQFVNVETLGAAELRHPPDDLPRMDAETGATDQQFGEAEVDQQLGQAGHQRDDARRAGIASVQLAERVRPLHDEGSTFK